MISAFFLLFVLVAALFPSFLSAPPFLPSSIGCGERDGGGRGGGRGAGDYLELSTFPLVVLLPVLPSFFFLCVDVILLLLSH